LHHLLSQINEDETSEEESSQGYLSRKWKIHNTNKFAKWISLATKQTGNRVWWNNREQNH